MTKTTKTITIKTFRTARNSRRISSASWDAAIETAENDERSQAAAGAAETCDEEYEDAIEALLDGDVDAARRHLEGARQLECEWGDDSPARAALAAL